MNRPQAVRRPLTAPRTDTSMRILEYAVGVIAVVAALVLGLGR